MLHNADTLVDGARGAGRLGYHRAAAAALSFRPGFRLAYALYRHLGIRRWLADRLADRVELLLMTRLLVDRLVEGGLLVRYMGENDRRKVALALTREAEALLGALSSAHRDELRKIGPVLRDVLARLER
jgi:DNA-binding MarR family transcriptional regulator